MLGWESHMDTGVPVDIKLSLAGSRREMQPTWQSRLTFTFGLPQGIFQSKRPNLGDFLTGSTWGSRLILLNGLQID